MAITTGGTHLLDAQDILVNQLELSEGMFYADLGIGSAAHFIFPAALIVEKEGKVYGLDIMKGVLEAAKSKARSEGLNQIETVWTDLEVYGAAKVIRNESIDRLSMVNLLFQTTQDEHVFNEANRYLKKGGKAVIVDWVPEGGVFGPPVSERTSIEEIRRLASIVGWKEVREFNPGPYHFGLVFSK